jgi:hypothetical protein
MPEEKPVLQPPAIPLWRLWFLLLILTTLLSMMISDLLDHLRTWSFAQILVSSLVIGFSIFNCTRLLARIPSAKNKE